MTTPPLLLIAAGRRPRVRRAPIIRPKELSLHFTVADVLRRFARPDWRWSHFPSGEHRDVRTATKLKAMGVARGWPDFVLLSPDGGRLHALELKRLGAALTEEQAAFAAWCAEHGVPHAVARTIDEALAVLAAWSCLRIKLTPSQNFARGDEASESAMSADSISTRKCVQP